VTGQYRVVAGDDQVDLVSFGRGGQRDPRREQLLDGVIAAGAGEDEHDRGEQPGPVEPVDDGDPRGWAYERGAVAALLALPTPGMGSAARLGALDRSDEVGRDRRIRPGIGGADVGGIEGEPAAGEPHVLPARPRAGL